VTRPPRCRLRAWFSRNLGLRDRSSARDLLASLEGRGVLINERETIKPNVAITDLNRVAKKILSKENADLVAFADEHSIICINRDSVGEGSDAVAGFIQSDTCLLASEKCESHG